MNTNHQMCPSLLWSGIACLGLAEVGLGTVLYGEVGQGAVQHPWEGGQVQETLASSQKAHQGGTTCVGNPEISERIKTINKFF